MFESVQKLAPWVSALPVMPKIAITMAWFLVSFVFFYVVWVPVKKVEVYDRPVVKAAYERMVRVLKRITADSAGDVLVDGRVVQFRDEYSKFAKIAEFVSSNPGDIQGAYEKVWENGGLNRSFTSDTEAFEAVVSGFAIVYYEASRARPGKSGDD